MEKIINEIKNKSIKIFKNPFLIFYYFFKSFIWLIIKLPYFHFIRNTKSTETEITFFTWFVQKIIGINKAAYWPMHHSSLVTFPLNIYVGIETSPGLNPGCYIHGVNKIYIGNYTQIAPNVGIISGNHDLYDYRLQQENNPIIIGDHSWLGMGCIILPGVVLGPFTIVGAGAIVTKSFPEGKCIIAGNPAKKIKELDPEKCVPFHSKKPYNGYIPNYKFEVFRKEKLFV